jgi:hypothetical protein
MPKAGNPNWGKPEVAPVITITEFEKKVLELQLQPDQFVASADLREWAAKHRNTHYVPEPLLEAWGFEVDKA